MNCFNIRDHRASLSARLFLLNSGKFYKEHELFQHRVSDWQDYQEKGADKESFLQAIASKQSTGTHPPLEYQYHVKLSPNGQSILVCHYDYGQKVLNARLKTFDESFNEVNQGQIAIDRNFVSYGFEIDDARKVYLCKVNRSGKVGVLRYNLESKHHQYLSLPSNSSVRDNLVLKIEGDQVYLAKLNKRDGKLTGLTLTRCDFTKEQAEVVFYHSLSETFKKKVEQLLLQEGVKRKEDWDHFSIIRFELDTSGFSFVLEEQYLDAGDEVYDGSEVNDIKHWSPAFNGQVHCGTVLLMRFDPNGELIWQNAIAKDQHANLNEGINSISLLLDLHKDKYKFIWTDANKGFLNNQLHFAQFNAISGEGEKHEQLSNPENLVLQRIYSLWNADGSCILIGRKGLIGKKSMIYKYFE